MNIKSSRSRNAAQESNLCQYPYADGRQCRMLRHASHPSLCIFHARDEMQLLATKNIGEEFSASFGELATTSDVHRAVAKLFKLVAQNRVPPHNARTLTHLAQILLQSQKGLRREVDIANGFGAWEGVIRKAFAIQRANAVAEHARAAVQPSPVSMEMKSCPLPQSSG